MSLISKFLRPVRITKRVLLSGLILSLLLAAAGPFGTFAAGSAWVLWLFWALVVSISYVFGETCYALLGELIGRDRAFVHGLAVMVAMTVFFTPVLRLLSVLFYQRDFFDLPHWGEQAFYVALLSGVICALRRMFRVDSQPRQAGAAASSAPAEPRLMRRLPEEFCGPILRLTVNDHFVDVVSASSTHRLRMRLGDAIDEMDTVNGYSTHRSHWVAQDAIAGVEREAGRIWLRLINGNTVPVSRNYKKTLEEAGVL